MLFIYTWQLWNTSVDRDAGNCFSWADNFVYRADVSTTDRTLTKHYIEMMANSFKERYRNHTKSLADKKYSRETELSKYVWERKTGPKTRNRGQAAVRPVGPQFLNGKRITRNWMSRPSNSVNVSWPRMGDTMGDSHEGRIVFLSTTRLCQTFSSG